MKSVKIVNRRFSREYEEIERFEAGIVLTGAEVKSIRNGNFHLEEAFVRIMSDGLYLVNADISIYKYSKPATYDSRHMRKLLVHKKEILRLATKLSSSSRLTIAPVACYNKGNLIKLQIALCKGRREVEKKKLDKARDIKLDQKREAKEYMKIDR